MTRLTERLKTGSLLREMAAGCLLLTSVIALVLNFTLQRGWPHVGFEGMMFWSPVAFWASAALGAAAWVLSVGEIRTGPRRPHARVLIAGSTLILLAWCVVLARS